MVLSKHIVCMHVKIQREVQRDVFLSNILQQLHNKTSRAAEHTVGKEHEGASSTTN